MNNSFQKVTVLGGGLLGCSIVAAMDQHAHSSLWFRKPQSAARARELNFASATSHIKEAVQSADLLILAVPIGAMPQLLELAQKNGLPKDCLVTDVGSVKQTPHRDLAELLATGGQEFIGSHPMAGSEKNGLEAARADLFQDAACLLTNDSAASAKSCKKLAAFWESLGCKTDWLSAKAHDQLVARISHLPHITAAATAITALSRDPGAGEFGGGGLRDTTRVASGNPEMWAEILSENREAIIEEVRDNLNQLNEVLASLENNNLEDVRSWLEKAKNARGTISP